MKVSKYFALVALSLSFGVSVLADESAEQLDAIIALHTLAENGGRVSWSQAHNLIAFDAVGVDGFYDIFTIRPNGTGLRSLTSGKAALPQGNIGQPAWHPSGDYMVFQAQDPTLKWRPGSSKAVIRFITGPGIGINNNLWLMNAEATKFWKLTEIKSRHGVLHPHFSPDGKKLLWAEKIDNKTGEVGRWAIKLADFRIKHGKPKLKNIKTLRPGNLQLYETHGFSPDGRQIIFTGMPKGGWYFDMEIYLCDLDGGNLSRLTDNDEWDEHAHFSPDGDWIIWASSEGVPQSKRTLGKLKLEYWIMKSDGSGKMRLTYFNDPEHPDYRPAGIIASDFDWSPEGDRLAVYLQRVSGPLKDLDFSAVIVLDMNAIESAFK